MKKIIVLLSFILLPVTFSFAGFDERKYLPDYVPYNVNDAIGMSDYEDCAIPLQKFDTGYYLLEWKVIPGSKEGSIYYRYETTDPSGITSLDQLKSRVEQEIRDCIASYPEYIKKKESDQAKKLAEMKAQEDAEERAKKIEIALQRCDFDFFKTLTNDEKMQTYDERKTCEQQQNITPATITQPVPFDVTPTETNLTQYTDPVKALPPQITKPKEVIDEIEYSSSSAQDIATTSLISLTEQELDQIVEEKLNQKLNEPMPVEVPEPQPSFFKKVLEVLFGWIF